MVMKNNLELIQEVIEVKLESINQKIDINNNNVVELLSFIREQTTRTNGRVTVLESRVNHLIEDENKHMLTCPRISDIKELSVKFDQFSEENFIVKVVNKWPKQVLGIIVAGVIITLITLSYGLYQGYEVMAEVKTKIEQPTK